MPGEPPCDLEAPQALCYTNTMVGDDGARSPATPAQEAGPGALVIIGSAIVVLAVVAAGTGVFRAFKDGVPGTGDMFGRAAIGALIGAVVGVLLVVGIRRLGAARTSVLGLTSLTAVLFVVVMIASVGATAGVATAPLGPVQPPTATVDPDPSPPATFPRETLPTDEGSDFTLPSWVGTVLAIFGILLILLLLAGVSRTFRMPHLRLRGGLLWGNRNQAAVLHEDLDMEAAADSFDDSAASIDDESDPRTAIIAAYVRLLDGLAEAGCPRLAHEAPEEHLRRSLTALGVQPEAMEVVVGKFLVARFSTHPLTEVDRDEVRTALRAAGGQLRAVVAARQAAEQEVTV